MLLKEVMVLLFKLLYLFQGYVIIQIKGYTQEKLINFLIRSDLIIWDVVKKEGYFEAKLRAKDFKLIRKYVKRAKCQVNIKSKHGLPFLITKLKYRETLVIGIVVSVLTLYILSSFVWFVEIKGLSNIPEKDILFLLNKAGFEQGMLKYRLDPTEIEKVINRHRQVSWVDVKLKGTKLLVDIVEKVTIEDLKRKGETANIVARKSGLVREVIVLEGQALVKEGEMVKKGENLISGIVKYYSQTTEEELADKEKKLEPIKIERVMAKGIVKAKVWYESYGEAKLISYYEQETEDIVNNFSISYKSKEINLYGSKKIPFKNFKVKKSSKSLPSWRNISFPIEIIRRRYIKIKELKEKRSLEEAKSLAKKRAIEEIFAKIDKDAVVIDKELKLISGGIEDNNIVRMKALVTTKEDIALQENIN
jgi:similar to stage IV sporulation protein